MRQALAQHRWRNCPGARATQWLRVDGGEREQETGNGQQAMGDGRRFSVVSRSMAEGGETRAESRQTGWPNEKVSTATFQEISDSCSVQFSSVGNRHVSPPALRSQPASHRRRHAASFLRPGKVYLLERRHARLQMTSGPSLVSLL